DGESFERADDYVRYLSQHLPEAYLTTRDMRMYVETLGKVAAGELSVADAIKKMPRLKRVGGSCPCSRAVRGVVEEPEAPGAGGRTGCLALLAARRGRAAPGPERGGRRPARSVGRSARGARSPAAYAGARLRRVPGGAGRPAMAAVVRSATL